MPPTCCKSSVASPDSSRARQRGRGWLRLALGSAAILVLWLAVLPWLANQPPIRRHVEFLERRQIDPSAMFYTELEPMGELRGRLARTRRDHPASFWTPWLRRDPQPPGD